MASVVSDSVWPIDGSPPGSPVPGILKARTLEWVAISFSNAWNWKVKVKSLSRAWLLATPWTAAYQAPPSIGLSRQEYWSGVLLPSPRTLTMLCLSSCPSNYYWLLTYYLSLYFDIHESLLIGLTEDEIVPCYSKYLINISEKAMATHSITLAWKIPWTEEPGRLQSMGSLRVRHDWATPLSHFTFMHWRS